MSTFYSWWKRKLRRPLGRLRRILSESTQPLPTPSLRIFTYMHRDVLLWQCNSKRKNMGIVKYVIFIVLNIVQALKNCSWDPPKKSKLKNNTYTWSYLYKNICMCMYIHMEIMETKWRYTKLWAVECDCKC